MGVRKNQNRLSATERARFIAAVKRMKTLDVSDDKSYDRFIRWHEQAFHRAGSSIEQNPAHNGPAFFPWHRYFINRFEQALQAADHDLLPANFQPPAGDPPRGQLSLPYWDWTHDNATTASIFSNEFMGGSGDPVVTGEFGQDTNGNPLWLMFAEHDTVGPPVNGRPLRRNMGANSRTLPREEDWDLALTRHGYDIGPWNRQPPGGPSLPSPGRPALAGTTGGSLPAGTYRVVITYMIRHRIAGSDFEGETRPSDPSTICLGAGCGPANTNNAIRVTAPPQPALPTWAPPADPTAAAPVVLGYKVYVTAAGGAAGTWTQQGGIYGFGTNATINTLTAGSPAPTTNTTGSFRNEGEGWWGRGLHNRVHAWMGGVMLLGTSPNDPIFFLHHCNVDRLWALWQFRHPGQNYPDVVPMVGVPGTRPQGLNSEMEPWKSDSPSVSIRARNVLNHQSMGYSYDTDPVNATIIITP